MIISQTIQAFVSGISNLLQNELIPQDAATDSMNWLTRDGMLQLAYGRQNQGAAGLMGKNYGEWTAFKANGTSVRFRKVQGTIQTLVGSTWTNVITGLMVDADYVASNYQSLAGAFVYFFGPDGIYKVATANPTDFASLYTEGKNYKGYAFIDQGRTILWGRAEDPTGLYGSNIDPQDSTVYTSVSDESLGSSGAKTYSGTLAFKAGSIQLGGTCFGVAIYAGSSASIVTTGITSQNGAAVTTATPHSLAIGDKVLFEGVVGMTQINGLVGEVTVVISPTQFQTDIDSSAFTTYVSDGTINKVEYFRDDFNGNLIGSLGGTGKINYMTGAYSFTTQNVTTTGPIADYQWEDSNNKGVTDFTHSQPRIAGEGFVIRQDAGGDAIQVVLPLNGSYFSMKKHSCYRFALDTTDLAPTNEIFRTDIGVLSLRSAVSTGKGIMYINTGNQSKPRFGILQPNAQGDNFDALDLFPDFDFSLYDYSDALVDTWDRYVILGCKQSSEENNVLLLGDVQKNTVDVTSYGIRTSTKDNGLLYGGDPVSQSTYELFTGFDDLGQPLTNFWNSKGELYSRVMNASRMVRYTMSDLLKKVRKIRIQGKIGPDQQIEVYFAPDDGDPVLIGTIRGDGSYVDYTTSYAIGTTMIGSANVGGASSTEVYGFFIQLKFKSGKFRKRMLQFKALGIGYAAIEQVTDYDIETYEQKMPPKYRMKQNVSLDGKEQDLPNPQY